MSLLLTDFAWRAPEVADSMEVESALQRDGASGEKPCLVIVAKAETSWRSYQPLADEPALFRDFAFAEPTPQSMVRFASLYGFLGISGAPFWFPGLSAPEQLEKHRRSESLEVWESSIKRLRLLLDLWDAAREGSREQQEHFAMWEDGDLLVRKGLSLSLLDNEEPRAARVRRPSGSYFVWPREHFSDILGRFEVGDLKRPLLWLVKTQLNSLLGGIAFDGFANLIGWSAAEGRPRLQFAPRSLWGALCLQLAEAVGEDRNYRRCPTCHRWIALAPGIARSDRLYCSNACRQRVYDQWKRQARIRTAEGASPMQIAKELGVKASMVKGWVQKKG